MSVAPFEPPSATIGEAIHQSVTIIHSKVDRNPTDASRAEVTFIVHSHDACDAMDFTQSGAIMDKGIDLCKKEAGISQVGIDRRGVSVYCDKEGKPLDVGFVDPPEEGQKIDHYYRVTHSYIGID
jgi:hypothetical protein